MRLLRDKSVGGRRIIEHQSLKRKWVTIDGKVVKGTYAEVVKRIETMAAKPVRLAGQGG